ncbi:hypothetical protein AKJ45_01075 [candidate division MSBL1 archaeon SCGC-AAA261F19]|uniref:Uncharacterized protein n=2 Tax=candidate division MSBL1 TaxID=215777 RepID=A0A133VAY8_9EURY|nr:hypothetical protein AKJ43_01265 [candidate division MSBL1 archaeon SCGC-AAA261D19]KXB03628.1 hypothetical protein AKJ45_01075 [candidate division MSBL1 archaeon SCGC-AAA261F19]
MTEEGEGLPDGLSTGLDLSKGEDLSVALMHLISLEEHLFFSAVKTGDGRFVELLREVRRIRTSLMEKIVEKGEGETWCISKHLLGCAMRLIETGDKALETDEKEAEGLFDRAFDLYSMFWGLNLGEKTEDASETPADPLPSEGRGQGDREGGGQERRKPGLLERAKRAVKDLLDCCRET